MRVDTLSFHSKRTSLIKQFLAIFLSATLLGLPLSAQPIGAKVISGSAVFKQQSSTLNITTSNKAIINYNSFNIGSKETLRFIQPSASSVVLNRVIMANPSSILGTLNANGKVFLVNPAGIYFGAGSSINANSFVATTLNIADDDFLKGNYAFNKLINKQSRAIVNQGTISVSDNGFVILSAPMVSNEGHIIAKAGNVVLGAGDNFYIAFDAQGLIRYDYKVVKNSDQPIVVSNAYANNIIENVLNTDSLKSAVSIHRDGDKVILSGVSGTILNSGTIDTSATQNVAAGKIELKANKNVYVLDKSKLQSNADKVGNGGVIDIYAQDMTYSDSGAIYEAKGGSVSGDGGFIEVSAKDSVLYNGSKIDMKTTNGKNGLFLIDPINLTINSDTYTTGADVLFQADEKLIVNAGVTISTRQIAGANSAKTHLEDASTGNSGSLTIEAKDIELASGSKLLTFADNGYNSGAIDLKATATGLALGVPVVSKITLNNAYLKGGDITLSSTATSTNSFDSSLGGTLSGIADSAVGLVADLSVPLFSSANADASVAVGGNSYIEGDNVNINSNANARASVKTIFTGIGVGYGKVDAKAQTTINSAEIKSNGTINIKSNTDIENSVKVYTIGLGGGRGSKANMSLAVAVADGTSQAIVNNGAVLRSVGSTTIEANMDKQITSSSSAGSYDDGTVGVGVSLSFSDTTTLAQTAGIIEAQSLAVKATTQNNLVKTSSSAGVGTGAIAGLLLPVAKQGFDKTIGKFLGLNTPSASADSGSESPALSAAFSYTDHKTTTTAQVGGKVVSRGNLDILATNTYPIDTINGAKGIKISSIGTIDSNDQNQKTYSVAGAVAVTKLDNKAYASIADDAIVDSSGNIEIHAKTYMPYEITWAQINSVWDITSKLNSNLGIQDGFFTTWVQSNSGGTVVGAAGTYNDFTMTNDTQAYIGQRAQVNQIEANPGLVRILAETDLQSLNLSGVFGIKLQGSSGGKGGVGGSYLGVFYNDTTKAEIRTDAKVDADALSLIADTKTKNISIAEAGGNAGKFGVSGSFSYLKTNNLTYANANGATINTKNGVDDRYKNDGANSNLRIMARDDSTLFNISGGITKAGNVGIGASASLNEIYRDTQASLYSTTFRGNGNTFLSAENSGRIDAFSLAGTLTTSSPLGLPSDAKGDATKGGKYGIGISGDTSINTITDSAKVDVLNSSILNGGKDFIVLAENNSQINSYSGSVALSTKGAKSFGLSGSYSQSSIKDTTEILVQNSNISSSVLRLQAINSGSVNTFSASGSGGTGGVQVAGSVSNNNIVNSTRSRVLSNSKLTATKGIEITTSDTASIKAIAGAVGFGGKAGIGASMAVNVIDNTIESSATDTDLDAQEGITITSDSISVIDLIVASLGVGTAGMAGSLAIGLNNIISNIKAYINGKYQTGINAGTTIEVAARDSSTIDSKAGQLALASKVALGASVMKNTITNTINAYIQNSDVSASGNIEVRAKSEKSIKNQSIAGAVSGSVAINGSVLINNITDNTNAHISSSKVYTDGSMALEASEKNSMDMLSLSLSASKYAGIGAVVALNKVNNNIAAYIDGGSDIYTGATTSVNVPVSAETTATQNLQGLDLIAYSDAIVTSNLASGAAGAGALTGVVSVNLLNNNVDSYIDGSEVNKNNTNANTLQSVRVRGHVNNTLAVFAGAVGVGGSSIGGTTDTTLVTNRVNAYVKDSLIYAKKSFDVNNQSFNRINNIVVSGSAAGSVAVAGSLEVLSIDSKNDAYINNIQVFSAGDTNIIASDITNLGIKKDGTRQSIVTGAAAIGGTTGIGGSVSVVTLKQDVKAHADNSILNTKKSTNILSNTQADVYTIVASGAISSSYLGAAGGVTVNSIDTKSLAYTSGTTTTINQDVTYESATQDVNVKADSSIALEDKVGAGGASAGAGVGASIDVATVKNTVFAKLADGSKTSAKRNVLISANSDKKVISNTRAVAGGIAGLAGSVSIININNAINQESKGSAKTTQTTTNNMLGESRVGSQLDDATLTADVDSQTQAVNVNKEFDTTLPAADSVHAVLGNLATLNSGESTTIEATDATQATILGGVYSVGAGVGVGGAVGLVSIGSDTQAYTGESSIVTAKNLNIMSTFNSKNSKIQTYTGSGGFVGLGASVSKLVLMYNTNAYTDSTSKVVVTDTLNIKAKTDISSNVEAKGAAIGAAAANAVIASVEQKGSTQAYLGLNTQTNAATLNINADTIESSNNYVLSAAGGVVSGTGASSTISSEPTVIAEIKDGATVSISASTDIKASASENLVSKSQGISAGGLAVGVALSDVSSKPILRVKVGNRVNFSSDNLTLAAYLNSTISSEAYAAAGALLGGAGASAIAKNDSLLSTEIGALSSVTTQKDLNMNAISDTNVIANSDGRAYGLLSIGATTAFITNKAKSTASISNSTGVNSGKDINIYAYSKTKSSSDVYGGAGGLLSGAGTLTKTTMINNVNVAIGSSSVLNANSGDINIAAVAHNDAYSKSDIVTAGAITINVSQAEISSEQKIDVLLNTNSKLSAKNITLTALSEKLYAYADARSKTIAANSFSTANSTVNMLGDLDVRVKNSAELRADSKLNILSTYANVYSKSKAFGTISAGVTGSVFANAANDMTLNSDILVENNAKIYSNDISIVADVPRSKVKDIYVKNSEAEAKTVVNYVLTAVDTVVNIVSHIPFIGSFIKKVVKTVMKWVKHILNSDTKATTPGTYNMNARVTMDGDIYQLPSGRQSLVIASDGTLTTQGDITAQVNANDVVVNNLINQDLGQIVIKGTDSVTGSGNIILSNVYPEVNIENYSSKNLNINKIDTVSNNANRENLNIYTASDTTNFNITAGLIDHAVNIKNLSASDIIFNDVINNYGGTTTIYNQGGNILANNNALIKTKALDISAVRGNIGTQNKRLEIEFVKSDPSNPYMVSNSFGATYLGLKMSELSTRIPASGSTLGTVDINNITANQNIDLAIHTATTTVTQYNTTTGVLDTSQHDVKSIYNVKNIKSKADITISGNNGVSLDVSGTMQSGDKDLLVAVDSSDPSINSSEFINSLTSSIVTLKNIGQRGGHINVDLSDGSLAGAGSVTVLDGYIHVKVKNDTDKNLELNAINTNDRVNGVFNFNGVAVTNIAVNNIGYASGDITVENLGTGTTTMFGDILNQTGNVNIKANNGLVNPNDSMLVANNIFIDLTSGDIGSSNNFVRINGKVNSQTSADTYLKSDDILTATNIKARNLELLALNNIDANLEVDKVSAISQAGNINLTSTQTMNIDFIKAANDIILTSTNGAINENLDSQVDIQGNTLLIKAATGIGSNHAIDTDVLTIDASNSISNDIVISDKGSLELKDIDSDTYAVVNKGGDIKITSESNLLLSNKIVVSKNITLESTTGSLLQKTNSIINAGNNIFIQANGNIKVSNIISSNNINVLTTNGDILGNNALMYNLSAANHLSLIANAGVIGTPTEEIRIKNGNSGVSVQASKSKGLISVYLKGADIPANVYKNFSLAVLNNRPVSGTKIGEYIKTLHVGTVNTKVRIQTNSILNSKKIASDEDYIE